MGMASRPGTSMHLLLVSLGSVAGALYVTPNASATPHGSGDLAAPFRSLAECIAALHADAAQRECLLLEGEHALNETAVLRDLDGSAAAPYVVGAAPGHTATLVGTVDVPGPWTWVNATGTTAGHWSAPMPEGAADPWQLFADGELMVVARWPNARWDDRTVFDDTYWAHGTETSTYCGPEQIGRDGVDGNPDNDPCVLYDGTGAHPSGVGSSLAASGINATGASAVLNIGHWYSFAGPVTAHVPGEAHFLYGRDPEEEWKVTKYNAEHDLYYLEGKLDLLDGETEWHYERATRTVHLRTAGDADPTAMRVTARVQEYAIAITGSSHVRISGLHLFATTVYAHSENHNAANDVHDITFDSLEFKFPSAQKRLLGDHSHGWPTTLGRAKSTSDAHLTVFNCTFFGAEGAPFLHMDGSGILIENNEFTYNDWTAVTTRPAKYFTGTFDGFGGGAFTLDVPKSNVASARNVVRRNRIAYSGASAALSQTKQLTTMELNHVSHTFAIQEDGALLQGGGLDPSQDPSTGLIDERNWVHDALVARSTKWGLRIDRTQSLCNGILENGRTWSFHTTFRRNVHP